MDDQSRAPLDERTFAEHSDGSWRLTVLARTGSTNADLLAAAAAGAPDRTVLVAELQTGGRGRLARSWVSPAGAGLTFSVLLRPTVGIRSWGWLPLLAGLAVRDAIGGDARLKWPNDLLLGPAGGKLAGILVQAAGQPASAVVVGVGCNVSTSRAELPVDTATSLVLQGFPPPDRALLLADLLAGLDRWYGSWQAAGGDAEASGLAAGYRAACSTLGQRVAVQLPTGTVCGAALDLDPTGRLLLAPDGGGAPLAVAAGDVTHLRPISG